MGMILLAVFMLPRLVSSIPVDNGVEGEPEIECGPTSITVNFNTRNAFQGHVYVKGLFDQNGCRSDEGGRQPPEGAAALAPAGNDEDRIDNDGGGAYRRASLFRANRAAIPVADRRVAGIELPFDTCNVARTRSLNPRGVFVSATIVVSFHPQFVTKVDRAYRVQCFYMEADKTVSTNLEVSELTTAFQTAVVPMPVCRYEILDGGPTGGPVQFANIGQQVYHRWICDSETTDTFCAVVHSCTVDDGNGDTVQILDDDGCALDRFLLNNLEYPGDLMAGQEAHVYKYADRAQLFYQCQISITIKEPNTECPRPQCAEPQGFGAVSSKGVTGGGGAGPGERNATPPSSQRLLKRRKRQTIWGTENTLDVRTEISALDIREKRDIEQSSSPERLEDRPTSQICLSPLMASLVGTTGIFLLAAGFFLGTVLLRPKAPRPV